MSVGVPWMANILKLISEETRTIEAAGLISCDSMMSSSAGEREGNYLHIRVNKRHAAGITIYRSLQLQYPAHSLSWPDTI